MASTLPEHSRDIAGVPGPPRRLGIGDLDLESGDRLADVELAYETWGRLDPDADNAVLVLHALTADSHAAAEAGEIPGWWGDLIGPGAGIDTERFFVVCVNMIGGCGGSTGPGTSHPADGLPYGSRFPRITLRDAARAEARLADELGIGAWHTVIGGSMGGARALEWGIEFPERVERLVVLAAPARSTADQLAWAHTQILAIESDPEWSGGDYATLGGRPDAGLGLARRIAHLTYRDGTELEERFQRHRQPGDGAEYQVDSYLDHQAAKLVNRFDAGSYVVLTRALRDHDIGRGRGGVDAALSRIRAAVTLIGIDSDRLYTPLQMQELVRGLSPEPELHLVTSRRGHDGFLMEVDQLAEILSRTALA